MFEVGNRWTHIHDRDRHQRSRPVCFVRRSLSNHHLVYQAHGGSDAPSNQTLARDVCHLAGEHAGRLRGRGTADAMIRELGRRPIVRIDGREKLELDAA